MAKRSVRVVKETGEQGGVPTWAKVLGGVTLLLAGLHFSITWKVGSFADQMTSAISSITPASHGGGYYTLGGDLGIRRFRVESPDGQSYLSIKGLELDTPHWFWTLALVNPLSDRGSPGRIFARARGEHLLPAARSLHVRLRGVDVEFNSLLPPGTPNLSFASAALFETEGCRNVRYFVPLNLTRDLRLAYVQTDVSMGYRAMGPDLAVAEFVLDAPGVMTTRYEMDVRTSDPGHLLEAADPAQRVTGVRLLFEDHGFIAARNRWCAEEAGVDADEFQRRHLSTVRRVLEVYGVRMSPETETVYQAFARDGGRLAIEVDLPDSFDAQRFSTLSPENQWALLGARIRHGEAAAAPMTMDFVKPRPLPRAYAGSVWDLLARAEDTTEVAEVSPLGVLGERVRALTREEGQADPLADTGPVLPEPPKPVEPERIELTLDTASLSGAIGRRVEVVTVNGQRQVGELIAVGDKTITIKRQVSGGRADLDFERERIKSAAIVRPPRQRG
jgi:hypothetical protein